MKSSSASTRIILDPRRENNDGTRPLKLRVIHERINRLFGINIVLDDGTNIHSLTSEDFDLVQGKRVKTSANLSFRDKATYKEIAKKLANREYEAIEIIKRLTNFTFEEFKKQLELPQESIELKKSEDVFSCYCDKIAFLQKRDKLGTASSYELSMKSLKNFIKEEGSKELTNLLFEEITADWLVRYENYMLNQGKSRTTIGIYLRPLRHLYNVAIEMQKVSAEKYPFGKTEYGKYKIPGGKKVKKALSKEQLERLFFASPNSQEQKKAKDFWFFSYSCNGMNIRDIAQLKFKNLTEDYFWFERQKVKDTTDTGKIITVMLSDYAKQIIELYKNRGMEEESFVFPILSIRDNEKEIRRKVQSFTRFINQHIKILAQSVGITTQISTYFARHSFATQAIQSGASIEAVGEAFGHSDIKTTKAYFAGFANNQKKELIDRIMSFANGRDYK